MRERIGSYHIEKVLAEGGMGKVYKGRHENLGRDAAIKTLLVADDAALRQRLLREAQAQARLHHPAIVAVYDLFEDQGELFIAMEYVDGPTLAALLDQRPGGRMAIDEALPLFAQVLDALEYVHAHQIVHRDVKPSNVMVCGDRAKLADFGIALLGELPRLTVSRQLIGSPPYMSPEQLEGKPVDARSDIYSIALVLYRMIGGREPFAAKGHMAQVHERLHGPPDLRALVPTLPAGVCEAIRIALRYDPAERFRSVAEFRDALLDVDAGFLHPATPVEDEPTVVRPAAAEVVPEPEPRRPTALVAIIVIVAAFAAASAVIVGQLGPQQFPSHAPARAVVAAKADPLPIIIETPAPPPQKHPERTEAPKPKPFAAPAEDPQLKRARELDALRTEIRTRIAHAHDALATETFATAIEHLDHAASLARQRPEELRQERDEVAELRDRAIDAQVAARTREAVNARWESLLADVEEHLRAAQWPEAELLAKNIANDLRAPDPVAARARALLQQAKDGRKNAFGDVQLGPTTNTIRKPSSPPRKDR